MSITIQDLEYYTSNKKSSNFELNINPKYEQNIHDNINTENNNDSFFNMFKNIQHITTDFSKDNTTKSICKNNDGNIQEINHKLYDILDEKDYYIFKQNNKDSFIGSILSIIDVNFCSASYNSKAKLIKEFKHKIGFDIDKNFKLLKYKKKMKKDEIQGILLNNKITDENTHIYIGDLLNFNIIEIINDNEYNTLNDFKKNRNNIILIRDTYKYCPLLNINNNNYFDTNTINKLKQIYIKKTFFEKQNLEKKVTGDIKLVEKIDTNDEIKSLKKMKLVELQEVAKKYNLDIHNDKKKKLKSVLLKEIIDIL